MVWGRSLHKAAAVLVTCTVLILLLGLNVSVLGLVHMSQAIVAVLARFFGLIAAIMLGNAAFLYILERRSLFRNDSGAGVESAADGAPKLTRAATATWDVVRRRTRGQNVQA